jgi:hypothetical protein
LKRCGVGEAEDEGQLTRTERAPPHQPESEFALGRVDESGVGQATAAKLPPQVARRYSKLMYQPAERRATMLQEPRHRRKRRGEQGVVRRGPAWWVVS